MNFAILLLTWAFAAAGGLSLGTACVALQRNKGTRFLVFFCLTMICVSAVFITWALA